MEAALVASVIFVFLVLQTTISFIKKRRTISEKYREIPQLQWTSLKLPIMDGLLTLVNIRREGVKTLEKIFKTYGPIVKCPVAAGSMLLVSDVDVIQKILTSSNSEHLNKPALLYHPLFPDFLKRGLVVSNFETLSLHRKSISQIFAYKSFDVYLKLMTNASRKLITKAIVLSENLEKNGEICSLEMKGIVEYHAFKLGSDIIMGEQSKNITDNEILEFQSAFRKAKDIVVERFLRPYLLIQPIWWFHPKKREMNAHMGFIHTMANKMVEKYRRKDKDGNAKHQVTCKSGEKVITWLDKNAENVNCHGKTDVIGGKTFSHRCLIEQMIADGMVDKEIADEVGTFLLAGTETVVTSLDMLIFHLALNTGHQQKCREEVDEMLGAFEKVSLGDISNLKYLERCILESLRLTPTFPAFGRVLKTPLKINDGWTLEKESVVAISPWVVHRDPKHYPKPEVFDPDRFLPENVKKRRPYSFIPFSMGPRNCIGWKLALMEMKVIMAGILRSFEMTTTDKLNDVKILFDVTLKPERPYNVTFKRRTGK